MEPDSGFGPLNALDVPLKTEVEWQKFVGL